MNKGDKHHYIPKFYLKQWAGSDGKVCEFSKPFKTVKPKRVHPDGTGYERGLYTFPNLPPHARDFIEKKLLQMADDEAHIVLQRMLSGDSDLDQNARTAWSRFLMSLMHRHPDSISRLQEMVVEQRPQHLEELRETFDTIKHPEDSRTYEDVLAEGVQQKDVEHIMVLLLRKTIDSAEVGQHLNNMLWGIIRFNRPAFPLLTSDRPTIMTNGIKYSHSHIVLPISPDKIFVAANTQKQVDEMNQRLRRPEAPKVLNDLLARQSRKYVYGTDDRQLRFVANRLGQAVKSTPFDYWEPGR